mmetsp:Transcript_2035/g.5042  ORF Transcript_2035/g.5042 Transcript_2035/m.5042 type:complete len:187 (+) Transcript_2035:506-1066(+)
MAIHSANYAIMGEELMPALFAIDPSTGVVLSNFVRTPDINPDGSFNGKFLSSKGDKVHCSLSALSANDCKIVDDATVDASMYVRHGSSGGYEGLVPMADGSTTAFIERNAGSKLAERGEPGTRVYRVTGSAASPTPVFESFLGFYKFEVENGIDAIADASALPNAPNNATTLRAGDRSVEHSPDSF